MSLTIIDAETQSEAAAAVFRRARDLGFRQNGDAGMGGFWVSQHVGLDTALTTSGAITCVIIAILTIDGNGALGHFAAEIDPAEVVRGVDAMLGVLGRPPIDAVLFAAGMVGRTEEEQQGYQSAIIAGTSQLAPGAEVTWRLMIGDDDVPDAAIFLPRSREIALFLNLPQQFIGRSSDDPGNGLAAYAYGAFLS